MHLGETIATYDLGLALRGESGKFEVTSPTGEIYHVTCKPNHSISNLEWAGSVSNPQPFMVRKITETLALDGGRNMSTIPIAAQATATATANQVKTSGSPFLLDFQAEDGEPLFAKDAVAMMPNVAGKSLQCREAAKLELSYLESSPETNRLVASVVITSERDSRAAEIETSITARCATLNELDAEIRKLHAQLDEIRARAKKKFYIAHAAATA